MPCRTGTGTYHNHKHANLKLIFHGLSNRVFPPCISGFKNYIFAVYKIAYFSGFKKVYFCGFKRCKSFNPLIKDGNKRSREVDYNPVSDWYGTGTLPVLTITINLQILSLYFTVYQIAYLRPASVVWF